MANQWIRLMESVRLRGVKKTIQGIMSKIEDHAFDLRYGTSTAQRMELKDLQIISENKLRGVNYVATHSKPFRKLVRELGLPRDKVFVDLGCGKGKVLMLAAQCGFKRVVGVEFSRDLCLAAKENVAAFQSRARTRTDVVIIESDAMDYAIQTDESIFFLFNPFDEVVLTAVLENIIRSFEKHNRRIWIIYNHPTWSNVIECQKHVVELGKYEFGSTEFCVYVIN